jgi:hypothetical protein
LGYILARTRRVEEFKLQGENNAVRRVRELYGSLKQEAYGAAVLWPPGILEILSHVVGSAYLQKPALNPSSSMKVDTLHSPSVWETALQ